MAVIVGALAICGCTSSPPPTIDTRAASSFDFPVDCGPIANADLCRRAVEVAATAKINPPPIVDVRIRAPRAGDDCIAAVHPCGRNSVIVVIQSGDTLQDVALVPTRDGWVLLDLVR